MNAQGYDSDARCIGTPQRIENVKGSSKSPAFRRMGLNDIIERSRDCTNMESWASAGGQDRSETPSAGFGMHFIPTPPGSIRGISGARHVKHGIESTGARSTPASNTSLPNQRPGEQSSFAKSLPSLHVSQEELARPKRENLQPRTVLTGSSGENLQNLVVDWAQYMDADHNEYGAASSESLTRQTSDIMVSKRRQPTSSPRSQSEGNPPYLGGADLSYKITGPNIARGPPSANPSVSDLPRANRYGAPMISLENIGSWETSDISTIVGTESQKQAIIHKRDVSSFYSRQSDEALGTASPAVHSLRVHAANVLDHLPNIRGMMTGEYACIEDGRSPTDEVIKSKLVDQFEAANSKSFYTHSTPNSKNGMNGMGSPRKVSSGWMTDGRRMGYGYSLVNDVDESPSKGDGNDNPLFNRGWDCQSPSPTTGTAHEAGMIGSVKQRNKLEPQAQPVTPRAYSMRPDSRCSSTKLPIDLKGEPILTPSMWAKIKSHSVRGHGHAPLAADMTGEAMSPSNLHNAGSVYAQCNRSPTPATVDYVEDTDGRFLRRWSRGSLSLKQQPQTDKNDVLKSRRSSCTPETSPIADRRLSMDQADCRPSAYFDPSNERSADKLNGQPSRSRSGRWVLRFSRNRESKKRSYMPPKEPSEISPVQYEEWPPSVDRENSTRNDIAADLANDYQECIQMPGSFYGSGWASRTSLVVEAE